MSPRSWRQRGFREEPIQHHRYLGLPAVAFASGGRGTPHANDGREPRGAHHLGLLRSADPDAKTGETFPEAATAPVPWPDLLGLTACR